MSKPVRTIKDEVTPSDLTSVELAIRIGTAYGGIDGGHHKQWVIDQMQRALMGCPAVKTERTFFDDGVVIDQDVYYEITGTSDAYEQYCDEYLDHYLEGESWEESYDTRDEALSDLWGCAP